jgi:hypothetical protein
MFVSWIIIETKKKRLELQDQDIHTLERNRDVMITKIEVTYMYYLQFWEAWEIDSLV